MLLKRKKRNECEIPMTDFSKVMVVNSKKSWSTINPIKYYRKYLECLMWFFLIKSTHLFYIKKCGYKRGTSFANGFKFPKMNSTEVVVLTRTTNFTKVMVLTLMKS